MTDARTPPGTKARMQARCCAFGKPLGALLVAGLVTGCASVPETPAGRDGSPGAGLYSGQPETVYATEFPVESAEDARRRAAEALNERDTDRALYFYVQAVDLDPEDADSLYRIGAIHERKGNRNLAVRAFARAIELEPAHGPALEGLGVAYFEARETERARETLERAIAADPTRWRAENVLGVIADMDGQYEAAIAHYSAALALRPGSASLLNNRGYSRYLAGDHEAAEADFRAALAANADYERAWQNIGLLYARQRKYGLALNAMSNVMARHVAANDIGYIAMLDGDYNAAEILFTEAKRASPRYYETVEKNLVELRSRRTEARERGAEARESGAEARESGAFADAGT